MRTLVHERDALVCGVEPCLSGDTGVALPDLELNAISGSCGISAIRVCGSEPKVNIHTATRVKAEVGARDLYGGLSTADGPLLRRSTIAIIATTKRVRHLAY